MEIGFRFANRYRITGLPRSDVRFSFYPAWDEERNLEVEVKTVGPALLSSAALWADSLRSELRRANRLDHQCIRAIHSFEMVGDFPVLVMERVEGAALPDFLRDRPSGLPELDFCRLASQAASALEHIHGRGLLLGGILWSEVRISSEFELRLADLTGLWEIAEQSPPELSPCTTDDLLEMAANMRQAGSSDCLDGQCRWKRNAAVEEQVVRNCDVTERHIRPRRTTASDLYALGRLLYTMLARTTELPVWGDLNEGHARALAPPQTETDWRPLVAGLLNLDTPGWKSAADVRRQFEERLTSGSGPEVGNVVEIIPQKESVHERPLSRPI